MVVYWRFCTVADTMRRDGSVQKHHKCKQWKQTYWSQISMTSHVHVPPETIDSTLDMCITYPLKLGGLRQHGLRSLTLLHMAGISNQSQSVKS